MKAPKTILIFFVCLIVFMACEKKEDTSQVKDPDKAEEVSVDRFSAEAGTIMIRDATNSLPGPNEAIDFDVLPFITNGLGPGGQKVEYYNFDAQPLIPAPIYVLFKEGESEPFDE